MPLLDALEAPSYFTFFWLFVCNRRFREQQYVSWKNGSFGDRILIVGAGISSLFCGLVIPAILIWVIFFENAI